MAINDVLLFLCPSELPLDDETLCMRDALKLVACIGSGVIVLSYSIAMATFGPPVPITKATVERQVADILKRAGSDYERKKKGLLIGRSYVRVGEYGKARQHLVQYLSVEPMSKDAHRMLGDVLFAEKDFEGAFAQYRKFSEIGGEDKEVLLKACEACAECSDKTVKTYGQYWREKAENVLGFQEPIFKLKERIASASTSTDEDKAGKAGLEKLVRSELQKRPTDVTLWIKLLDALVSQKKHLDAYNEGVKMENRSEPWPYSIAWQLALKRVFEACLASENGAKLKSDLTFHYNYLRTLDKRCFLAIGRDSVTVDSAHEPMNIGDIQGAVADFDTALFEACEILYASKMKLEWFEECLNQLAGNLLCHMGALLIIMVKKGAISWTEALPMCAHLLWSSYSLPVVNSSQAFLKQLRVPVACEASVRKLFGVWGHYRASQTGHALANLKRIECGANSGDDERLEKGYYSFANANGRLKLVKRVFGNRASEKSYVASKFNVLSDFASKPGGALLFPNPKQLLEDDRACLPMVTPNLHLLIWVCIQDEHMKRPSIEIIPDARSLQTAFPSLAYGKPLNLSATAEALCLLDLEAFLCATAFCTAKKFDVAERKIDPRLGDTRNMDTPGFFSVGSWYPPAVACDVLCNEEQIKFWNACYNFANKEMEAITGSQWDSSVSPFKIVSRGVSAIRLDGHRGAVFSGATCLSMPIVIHLAKHFSAKVAALRVAAMAGEDDEEELIYEDVDPSTTMSFGEPLSKPEQKYLEARASLYWNEAVRMIESSSGSGSGFRPSSFGFDSPSGPQLFPEFKNPKADDMNAFLEAGRFYLARQMMVDGKREEALKAFSTLKSPKATMCQAKIYEMSAGEASTGEEEMSLLIKARAAIQQSYDRLNSQAGLPGMSLPTKIFKQLNALLDNALARVQSKISTLEAYGGDGALNISNGHDVSLAKSALTPFTIRRGDNRLVRSSGGAASTPYATPRSLFNSSLNGDYEVRPSPERLDAQLKSVIAAQEVLVQATNERNAELTSIFNDLKTEVRDMKVAVESLVPTLERMRELNERSAETIFANQIKKYDEVLEQHARALERMGRVNEQSMETISKMQAKKYEEMTDQNTRVMKELLGAITDFTRMMGEMKSAVDELKIAQRAAAAAPPPPAPQPQQPQPPVMMNPWSPAVYSQAMAAMYQQQLLQSSEFGLGFKPPVSAGGPTVGLPSFSPGGFGGAMGGMGPFNVPPPGMPQLSESFLPQPTQELPVRTAAPVSTGMVTPSAPAPSTSALRDILNAPPATTTEPSSHAGTPSSPVVSNSMMPLPSVFSRLGTGPAFPSMNTSTLLSNVPAPQFSAVKSTPPAATSSPFPLPGGSLGSMPSLLTPPKFSLSSGGKSDSPSEEPEEHDALPDFKPIVPLPDEVEVTTGEEGWEVLIDARAKLFRFVDGEWKERGLGQIKILKYPANPGKRRVVMRREAVFKVCCNHVIDKEMVFDYAKGKADWISWAAKDFSDEDYPEGVDEKFAARFKTKDLADEFLKIGRESAKAAASYVSPVKAAAKPAQKAEPAKDTTSAGGFSFGGLTFASPPTVVEPEKATKTPAKDEEKKQEAPRSGIFTGFSFLGSSAAVSFGTTSAPASSTTTTPSFTGFDSLSAKAPTFGSLAGKSSEKPAFGASPSFSGFRDAGKPVFGGLAPASGENASEDGTPEEYEPDVDFKPIVPLPPLVEVKTGEEDEEKLFGERAKIFRFDQSAKEWKERGIGEIKILRNKETGKKRVLMRREQVMKLCANFMITDEMEIKFHQGSDKQLMVIVAADASDPDEPPTAETFLIRFKFPERAAEFKRIFERKEETKAAAKAAPKKAEQKPMDLSSLSQFKPKAGSWECDACLVRNEGDAKKCAACETWRPGCEPEEKEKPKSSFSFGFKPAATTTPATTEESKPASSFSLFKPPAATTSTTSETKPTFSFAFKPTSVEKPAQAPAPAFSFKPGSSASATAAAPAFNVGKPADSGSSSGFSFKFDPSQTLFTIGTQSLTAIGKEAQGVSKPTTLTESESWNNIYVEKQHVDPATAQMLNQGVGFSFDAKNLLSMGGKEEGQEMTDESSTSSSAFKFTLPDRMRRSSQGEHRSPRKSSGTENAGDEEDGSEEEEEEDNIYFKPIIPLPPLVDLKSGEEDEEVFYSHRAKLYRFVDKEWKERGIGDIKILKNRETGACRFLMRREQVHKICLNHYLTPDITFKPLSAQDEKSWMWAAIDFSEDEKQEQTFALRFKTKEIAEEFLKSAKEAQELTRAACSGEKEEKKPEEKKEHEAKPGPNFGFSFGTPAAPAPGSIFGGTATTPKSVSFSFGASSEGEKGTDAADDVQVIYEKKVDGDRVQKALKLKLPPNFFDYELKDTTCPGCRGCDDEWDWTTGRSSKSTSSAAPVTPKPAEKKETTEEKGETTPVKPSPFGNISFTGGVFGSAPRPVFGEPAEQEEKKEEPKQDETTPEKVSPFGTTSYGGGLFGPSTGPSFADLAKPTPSFSSPFGVNTSFSSFGDLAKGTPGFGPAASTNGPSASFSFPGAGTTLFGGSTGKDVKKEEEGTEESEDSHDPHFEPIVPLPALVQIKTGEEDEVVVYSHRAKLFRYATETKEWKERGLGDIKILQNPKTGKYRVLQRREVVHKIACNFPLLPEMDLLPMNTASNAWMVYANDYDEEEGWRNEQFSIKFKNEDIAKEFKKAWDECKEKAKLAPKSPGKSSLEVEDISEDEEDYEDDENLMREIEAKLLMKGPGDTQAKDCGDATIRFTYDERYGGIRVFMNRNGDEEDVFVDTMITDEVEYETDGTKITWQGVNYIDDEGDDDQPPSEYTLILPNESEMNQTAQLIDDAKMMYKGAAEAIDEAFEDEVRLGACSPSIAAALAEFVVGDSDPLALDEDDDDEES